MESYPSGPDDRDRFVLDRRGERPFHDAWRHQALIVEDELTAERRIERVAAVFLTGSECPWRCAMCDLWRHTIEADTPAGAIPAQVAAARRELSRRQEPVTWMKLYNAGSFFDPRAVPEADYDGIAAHLAGLSGVVVESHPSLVGPRVDRFLEALDRHRAADKGPASLEVAVGLETAHPEALERLHKRMTVEGFERSAEALGQRGVALRVFLLISPPFVPPDEQDIWLLNSIDVAFACGASVISLVPTRSGNGALEALAAEGCFRAPRLAAVERSIELAHASRRNRGRILVDVWDLERFADCTHCLEARRMRLHAMNLEQRILPPVPCASCGAGAPS